MGILLELCFTLGFVPYSVAAPSLLVFPNNALKNPVGNHVASYFHHCLSLIVDFSTQLPFNYETSDVPRTFYNYPSSYLRNYTFHNEIDNSREIWHMHRGIQKMQRFRCILTMLSVLQGTVDLNHAGISLNRVLSQYNVFGDSASISGPSMPEYFVVFSVLDENLGPVGSDGEFTHDFVRKFFHARYAAHLPALFALQIRPVHDGERLKGFFYCWYCAAELKLSQFTCTTEARCPAEMMDAYSSILSVSRRNIPWIYFKRGQKVQPLSMSNFCPLTLGRNASCLAEEIDIVGSFLTEGSNRSAVANIVRNTTFWNGFPSVSYKRAEPGDHPMDVLPVGRSVQFRFITADGIQSDRASFASFAAPFSDYLWLALGCTTIFLAISVAALSNHSFICTLPRNIVAVIAPLLEKVTFDARVSHATQVVMTSWIFVAIVITTSYKCMMKSNYMIEPKYATKWKSLREIENFTLIHAENIYDETWRNIIMSEFKVWEDKSNVCMKEAKLQGQTCSQSDEHLFWQSYCVVLGSMDERFACGIFELAWRAAYFCAMQQCPDDEKFKNWLNRRQSFLQNMASHSRIRPFRRIRNVIHEQLLLPRTAFVSPAENFDGDWKIFEEESRVLHVRFSYSEHSEDFGSMFGYQLTSGFNEHVGEEMQLRAQMLMESGIFWLWKKWEKFRLDFGNGKSPSGKKFVELSFRNSDIHLTFAVYLIGVLVALIFRGAEYLWFRGFFGSCN